MTVPCSLNSLFCLLILIYAILKLKKDFVHMSFLFKYKYLIFLIFILPGLIMNPISNLFPLLMLGLAICIGKLYEWIKRQQK